MKKHDSFILIFEGIDASGKTLLSQKVYEYFKTSTVFERNGTPVTTYPPISFPNYKSIPGQMIETLLNRKLDDDLRKILAQAFALDRKLYNYPTRMQFKADIFIFNRYYPSNLAYNYELGLDYLMSLERDSYIGNKVFILDVDPEVSFERRPERRDENEKDLNYMHKVRENYLELARRFGWVVLDGTEDSSVSVKDIINLCVNSNDGFYRKELV